MADYLNRKKHTGGGGPTGEFWRWVSTGQSDPTMTQTTPPETKSEYTDHVVLDIVGDTDTDVLWMLDRSGSDNSAQPHLVAPDTPIFGADNGYTSRGFTKGTSVTNLGIVKVPWSADLEGFSALSYVGWIEVDSLAFTNQIMNAPHAVSWASFAQFGVQVGTTGRIVSRWEDGTNNKTTVDAVTAGVVAHIAVTWDGTNVGMYIDGALDSGGLQTFTGSLSLPTEDNGIVFGNRSLTDPNVNTTLAGRLQGFGLFDVALSSGDVAAIFAEQDPAGSGGQRNLADFFDMTNCVLALNM